MKKKNLNLFIIWNLFFDLSYLKFNKRKFTEKTLTFKDLSHREETGDALGNFSWHDGKVRFDLGVSRWIGAG